MRWELDNSKRRRPSASSPVPGSRGLGPGQVHALGLENSRAPVPISVFWLVPQYCIIGAAEILVNIGTMELFYSEVPA